jgi:hypothetical protein
MKKETLEEAAENHLQKWRLLNNIHLSNILHAERCKNDFIEGAKWQQERMYSEEDMKEAFKSGRMVKNYKAEWEETYSDEMTSCKYEDFKQWFEQFKK